jgi:GNAT superfamily N-acetyltransferase
MSQTIAHRVPDLEFRPFRPEDELAVVALLQDAFGGWPSELPVVDPARFFAWKHRMCPFGESLATVAVDDGRIVGYLAWLPWTMRSAGETIRTFRTVDFAVARSHRGGAVAMALIQAGKRQLDDDYAFSWSNPNRLSRNRAGASGQGQVGVLPIFVRPSGRGVRARLGGPPAKAASEKLHAGRTLAEDEGWLSGLCDCRSSGRLRTSRDPAFLRWRYGAFPQYLAVRAEGAGIVIFRRYRRGRVWVARVCELLAVEDSGSAARRLVGALTHAVPVDLVACAFPSPDRAAQSGFMPSRKGCALTVRPARQGLVPDPTNAASWELSLGDLELV